MGQLISPPSALEQSYGPDHDGQRSQNAQPGRGEAERFGDSRHYQRRCQKTKHERQAGEAIERHHAKHSPQDGCRLQSGGPQPSQTKPEREQQQRQLQYLAHVHARIKCGWRQGGSECGPGGQKPGKTKISANEKSRKQHRAYHQHAGEEEALTRVGQQRVAERDE